MALTKVKNWDISDGPWKVKTDRERGPRVICRDDAGSTWQCYEMMAGDFAVEADHALAQSVLDAMAADAAARAAARAAAQTKADAAQGPAVRQKLRDVAAGTGSLTQPQIARLFLHLLNDG